MVIESTYGDRIHEELSGPDYVKATLRKVIRETFAPGGNVVDPILCGGPIPRKLSTLSGRSRRKDLLPEYPGF
ncbi:hypothetical protein [Sellimonas intestinalis]|uniref:hypothetical protein n=1 Tax=Sellimonas intestinalis TaxID=1653434 RepID=UPI00399B2041